MVSFALFCLRARGRLRVLVAWPPEWSYASHRRVGMRSCSLLGELLPAAVDLGSISCCRQLRLSATAAPCAKLPLADRLLRCTVFTHSQKTILKQTDVPIPDGVKVTVKARVVVVKGPRGEVKKDLTHLPLDITVTKNDKGEDIVHVERWFTSGKAGASIQSACSHIENMIVGVTKVRLRRRARARSRTHGAAAVGVVAATARNRRPWKVTGSWQRWRRRRWRRRSGLPWHRLQCSCKGGGRCGAPGGLRQRRLHSQRCCVRGATRLLSRQQGRQRQGAAMEEGGGTASASALSIDRVGRPLVAAVAPPTRALAALPRVWRPWPLPLTRPPRACARLSPQGFEYKMRFVYAHFPINVTMANKGTRVEIRNFLGEKIVRVVECDPGVTVTRTVEVKDEIVLVGNDINCVSRTAALIQQICAVKRKDIRKFLDGIYVSAKGNVVKS